MLQIIVEHTHLVISQYAHNATNNGRVHTTLTFLSWVYAHTISVKPGRRKKRLEDVSRKTFTGTNTTFLFLCLFFNLSVAVCRSSSDWNEGLVWACRDTKCLSVNKHTDQSINDRLVSLTHTTHSSSLTPQLLLSLGHPSVSESWSEWSGLSGLLKKSFDSDWFLPWNIS